MLDEGRLEDLWNSQVSRGVSSTVHIIRIAENKNPMIYFSNSLDATKDNLEPRY
jgi:hypothetical protein